MYIKINLVLLLLLILCTSVQAEESYCFQRPDKCAAGDILILSISDDVAKYCDFDKQIIAMTRRTTSQSFNNQEVVCVKAVSTRRKLR